VEDVVIRKAFYFATDHLDDGTFFAKRFFDHPAISADDYSDALYDFYIYGCQTKELFYWLLARADCQDLWAVRINKRFSWMKSGFQQAVNQAVGIESRHKLRRPERIAAAKEALEFSNDIFNRIAGYIE
jgi:hypothetical protein